MDVSIIIVNYNSYKMVLECIDSIYLYTKNVTFEIIVIDNASNEKNKNILSKERRIRYYYLENNIGFGMANNEGFKYTSGKYIFCLNPDTILINNAVKILCDFLDKNSNVGICGGNLYDINQKPTLSFKRIFPSICGEVSSLFLHLPERFFFGRNWKFNYTNTPFSVCYITGADLMIRRSLINKYGFYHSSFFMYYEDVELCYRMYKQKIKIYSVPEAKIFHLEGKTQNNLENKANITFKARDIFYHSNYSKLYIICADFIYVHAIILRLIILSFKKKSNIKYWNTMFKLILKKYI